MSDASIGAMENWTDKPAGHNQENSNLMVSQKRRSFARRLKQFIYFFSPLWSWAHIRNVFEMTKRHEWALGVSCTRFKYVKEA